MVNTKFLSLLGALLLVSSAIACKNCIADSLMNAIDQYDKVRHCWFYTHKNFLLKEKIYTVEALNDAINEAININNNLVEDKCKMHIDLKSCTMDDNYTMSECLMASLREQVEVYRKQEQCHGEGLHTEEMEIAQRLILGNIIGWRSFHPDC